MTNYALPRPGRPPSCLYQSSRRERSSNFIIKKTGRGKQHGRRLNNLPRRGEFRNCRKEGSRQSAGGFICQLSCPDFFGPAVRVEGGGRGVKRRAKLGPETRELERGIFTTFCTFFAAENPDKLKITPSNCLLSSSIICWCSPYWLLWCFVFARSQRNF